MKALELFSGIGGMHFALEESGVDCQVACALDINTTANAVYRHNFPGTKLMENNVQCLCAKDVEKMGISLITMSPPCQPFTRVGLKKDEKDNRTSALQHILDLLPELTTVEYILLENVVGFETSNTRENLMKVLRTAGFRIQEFIISPCQLFIPNSRSRYFLLARKQPFPFDETDIRYEIPPITELNPLIRKYETCGQIRDILDNTGEKLSDKTLQKYGQILDIVTGDSKRSCCFTKGYSHYAEGTGSVFCPRSVTEIDKVYAEISAIDKNEPDYLTALKSLEMRYFSPKEVAKLMAFPSDFSFPPNLTDKQKYRLLGNSLNVHVVAVLIKLLLL